MLNLSGTFKYYFCLDNVSFRCRHNGMCSYIKNGLHRDPCNGDVYVFMSKDQKKLRVLYYHHQGVILSEKILLHGKYLRPMFDAATGAYRVSWADFVRMLEGIVPDSLGFRPE